MPPLPSVSTTIRVHLGFSTSLRSFGSRAYYRYSGTAPSDAVCATIAGDIEAAFASDLKSLMSSDYSLVQVGVTDLSSPSGGFGQWTGTTAGTRSDVNVPVSVATVVDFQIPRRYRGGKPKIFLPFGVQSDLLNAEEWNSAFTAAMDSGWSSFDTAVLAIAESGTTLTDHVNVSYYEGFASVQNPVTHRWRNIPTPRTSPVVDVIQSHATRARVGAQRRRTRL